MTAAISGSIWPSGESPLRGSSGVLRLVLRRDRVLLPLWIAAVVAVMAGSASATASTYPTAAALTERFQQVHGTAMFPLFQAMAFDDSRGAIAAQQVFGATTLVAALGAVLLVVRHTRAEEQHGRRELVGSTSVGRGAPLAAPLLAVLAGAVVIGGLTAVILAGSGLPAVGSLLLGLMITGASCLAAALAAVTAQLTGRARTAGVLAVGIVLALHFLRGAGHLAGEPLGWLTTVSAWGWLEGVRPFAGDRWWMLLPVGAASAALVLLAAVLSARRDLGSGILAARPGRSSAPSWLRGPLSLALRRAAGGFLVWGGPIALIGLAFGSLGSTAGQGYADSVWMARYAAALGLADPAEAFVVYVVFVMVFPIAIHSLLTVLRLRAEETDGTADLLLTTSLPRTRWALATVLTAFATSAGLLFVLGISLAITSPDVGGLLPRALSLTPAVWALIGVAVLCIGFLPRAAVAVTWCALAAGVLGELLVKAGLPDAVYLSLSPIAHVNPYYATDHAGIVLTALAAVSTGLGLAGLRRRDLSR